MSTDQITIRREALTDELMALYLASTMSRGVAGREAIEWRFFHTPDPFFVGRIDGEVMGVMGYLNLDMEFDGVAGRALHAVDGFVSERARGKGLFTRFGAAYHDHAADIGADLAWGFPNPVAARVWFGRQGWTDFGTAPFLFKPLRAGYALRKLGLGVDFPLSVGRDQGLEPVVEIGDWVETCWAGFARSVRVATRRSAAYLEYRLMQGPMAPEYRVVAPAGHTAFVATRQTEKHGGRIGYVMEAFGEPDDVTGVLISETARMRSLGTEVALAWCHPWQPNYKAIRRAGFLPLPRRFRPVEILHGGRAFSPVAAPAIRPRTWYLSYLDSDTV
ncbi:MAG: hypothetical protein AAF317_15885 [Pseudomonadota bacterium]